MFRKKYDEAAPAKLPEEPSGRYRVVRIADDRLINLKGPDAAYAEVEKELNAGAAKGWVPIHIQSSGSEAMIVVWDTDPA